MFNLKYVLTNLVFMQYKYPQYLVTKGCGVNMNISDYTVEFLKSDLIHLLYLTRKMKLHIDNKLLNEIDNDELKNKISVLSNNIIQVQVGIEDLINTIDKFEQENIYNPGIRLTYIHRNVFDILMANLVEIAKLTIIGETMRNMYDDVYRLISKLPNYDRLGIFNMIKSSYKIYKQFDSDFSKLYTTMSDIRILRQNGF